MQTLHKILRWPAWDCCVLRVQLLILCHFVSVSWDKILKYAVSVKICHQAKLQAFVKMKMARNQPKVLLTGRIFRELNKVTLAELPSKLLRVSRLDLFTFTARLIIIMSVATGQGGTMPRAPNNRWAHQCLQYLLWCSTFAPERR